MRTCAYAILLSMLLVSPISAQKNANTQVLVTNTASRPVPTTVQGTATVTGNVNVTNSSLPVSGNVSITNPSVPVTGSVSASNLPLDLNGNVRTSVARDATRYQFVSITATEAIGCVNSYGQAFCTLDGSQWIPIDQTLTSLSAQGYELVSVVSIGLAGNYNQMLYTLRIPQTNAQAKRLRQ